MEKTVIVQTLHQAMEADYELSVHLKNGHHKSGKPLHFINETFLIIQAHNGHLKHDLILVEDIQSVAAKE
jgi:hypothetical protein